MPVKVPVPPEPVTVTVVVPPLQAIVPALELAVGAGFTTTIALPVISPAIAAQLTSLKAVTLYVPAPAPVIIYGDDVAVTVVGVVPFV